MEHGAFGPLEGGVGDGETAGTRLPDALFRRILPALSEPDEFRVTLHLYWLLSGRSGGNAAVSLRQLQGDRQLIVGLRIKSETGYRRLRVALEAAVQHRNLLVLGTGDESVYLLNTPIGRREFERMRQGGLLQRPVPQRLLLRPEQVWRTPVLQLYEQQVGSLTATVAGELEQLVQRHGDAAVAAAIDEAVAREKRSWAYIRSIIERGEVEIGQAFE